MDAFAKYRFGIVALLGVIFLILNHMSQLVHIDEQYWDFLKDIGYTFSDEIWIAAFISIIIWFVVDKAAHERLIV